MHKLSPSGIPYMDFGGQGPPLHFAHANGFPPGTYNAFIEHFTDCYHVLGMECRALWGSEDPAHFRHWRELAEDLARFVAEMNLKGAIAIGHSLGAVTSLFCAAAHPGIFKALVLIDPVIMPAHLAPIWALAILLRLNRQTRLSKGARRRRMEWPNREIVFRAYRAAPVFSRWQDQFLRDYVAHVTEDIPGDGVHLRYPREWEARIFETVPPDSWLSMPRVRDVPLLVLRGQLSTTFTRSTMRLMRWLLPQGTFLEIEGADHFVPMSRPEKAAAAIQAFLRRAYPKASMRDGS
jgi:pimeloyl-ACP methyl ester carboxylesterase